MSQIFNITHDAGNLDEYDSLVNAVDLSAETAAAMANTPYGLQVLINSTAATYGQKLFTQITTAAHRFRFYFDPNTLTMASGTNHRICRLNQGSNERTEIGLAYDGTNYEIRVHTYDDGLTGHATHYHNITDEPHYIEVLVQYATGAAANDGSLTLWVDGALQEIEANLDIYNISKPDRAQLGAVDGVDGTTSGTSYFDEFVLRDDDTEIGPVTPAGFAAIF